MQILIASEACAAELKTENLRFTDCLDTNQICDTGKKENQSMRVVQLEDTREMICLLAMNLHVTFGECCAVLAAGLLTLGAEFTELCQFFSATCISCTNTWACKQRVLNSNSHVHTIYTSRFKRGLRCRKQKLIKLKLLNEDLVETTASRDLLRKKTYCKTHILNQPLMLQESLVTIDFFTQLRKRKDVWVDREVSGGSNNRDIIDCSLRWDTDDILFGNLPRFAGFLQRNVHEFDSKRFAVYQREVESMDPQQRQIIELAAESFDSNQLDPEACSDYSYTRSKSTEFDAKRKRASSTRTCKDCTSVFLGLSWVDFSDICAKLEYPYSTHSATGTSLSVAAGRLAYTFDFHGTALTIDTACSSSLVALSFAFK